MIGKRPKVRRRQRAFIARQRRRVFSIQVAGIYVTPTHTITVHVVPRGERREESTLPDA